MPTGIKFVYKIMLLLGGCIALTGLVIALLLAHQSRRDLLILEESASYTVYQAAVNYLTGHYYSKRENFVPASLNFVFSNRFLVAESGDQFRSTHRPSHLTLYRADGAKLYDFSQDGRPRAPDWIVAENLPDAIRVRINANKDEIIAEGPLDRGGDVPGYVVIRLPTDVGARLRALYLRAGIILLAGMLAASALGYFFSRRFLAPVEALTDAARRVHAGDYACRIPKVGNDEIGLLTETFNEMIASWVRRLSLMHRIQEWTLKVGNEFDRHRLYGRLLDMFYNVASARQCALYLRDGDKKELPPAAIRGEETLRPEVAGWIRYALEKNEPVLAERRDLGPRAALGNVEHLVLPLVSGEQTVGAVYLGPPTGAPAYDREMVATLQTLAQHAGIAVENARLLNEVAEKKRIEQEMMWARDIQRTLLPHHPPKLNGYAVAGLSLPANEVGGDYYDYIPRDDQRCHIIVSDVSGKGVAAGLIMSVLRSLVHTYSEFETCPHEILIRVNRVLTRDLDEYMFVTATMMTLEPDTHALQVARAGHEPVLIVTADGEVQWIRAEGTALGLLDVDSFEAHFTSATYTMQPGDLALLYTDGVNEAQNEDGEEFGIDRLVALAVARRNDPLDDLLAGILRAVNAFAGQRRQQDDITLVALRRDAAG
ncbi:MAG TPA: SpoIIE family protein phosphatase [Kiritimatiellia bacterium]|nr:SpoIIE family protein phosphatase [Kiritimatiellia bacterium]HMO99856.1 SpoIIE family protein phosphatase [Kiritimatiellia bacterium]HMP96368.1 SpoIIE family protein phosphatase [Kiritimatiellia bacterium]